MARISLNTRWIGLTVLATAAVLAGPAVAQFGSIFREEPPRPPADVPGARSSQPPTNYPGRPEPNYPGQQQQNYPSRDTQRAPGAIHSDLPPAAPLPAPMSLPPSSRPGGGSIQSQPLPPPPGTAPPAQATAPAPGQPNLNQQGMQTSPGLPPGQRQPRGALQQPADTSPQPGDEVVVAPPPQRISNPTAVFAGLDKITGRIIKFDVAINETVQFGALQVTPRVCYSRPPTETPNTDSFVEVDEVTLQGEIKRIFTGWMFAASPGLHAVEHPIYDVWLTDCKGGQNPSVAEVPEEPQKPAAKPAARSPQRTPPRGQPRTDQRGLLPAVR